LFVGKHCGLKGDVCRQTSAFIAQLNALQPFAINNEQNIMFGDKHIIFFKQTALFVGKQCFLKNRCLATNNVCRQTF